MELCASCGQPIRPDDGIAIREGKIYHSRCWTAKRKDRPPQA